MILDIVSQSELFDMVTCIWIEILNENTEGMLPSRPVNIDFLFLDPIPFSLKSAPFRY